MKPYDVYIFDRSGCIWTYEVPNAKEWSFQSDNYLFSVSILDDGTIFFIPTASIRPIGKVNPKDSVYNIVELSEKEIELQLTKKASLRYSLITGFPYSELIVKVDNDKSFKCDGFRISSNNVIFYQCNFKGDVKETSIKLAESCALSVKLQRSTKQLPVRRFIGPFHISEFILGEFDSILSKRHWTRMGWKENSWIEELTGNITYNSNIFQLEVSYDYICNILTLQSGEIVETTTEGFIRSNSSMDPGDDEWGYQTSRLLWCAMRCTSEYYSCLQKFLSQNGIVEETKFIWGNTITQTWKLRGITKFDLKEKFNISINERIGTSKWRS